MEIGRSLRVVHDRLESEPVLRGIEILRPHRGKEERFIIHRHHCGLRLATTWSVNLFFFVRPNTKKTLGGRRKPLQSAKGKKNTTQNKTYEMNQMTRQLGWPARNRWGKTVLGASAGSKVANGLGSLGRCCCWPRRAKKKWAETAPKLERQENDWRHITLRPIGPARIHPSSLLIATVYFFFTDPPSLPTPVHVQIAIFQFLSTSTALGVPARDLTTFSSFN